MIREKNRHFLSRSYNQKIKDLEFWNIRLQVIEGKTLWTCARAIPKFHLVIQF